MSRHRLGLIVNPIAGMGGAVGLKGTDGELVLRARELGAEPVAPQRAGIALHSLAALADRLVVATCRGEMGEDVARAAGLAVEIAYVPARHPTTATDTRDAAATIVDAGVALLLFVGGDGTARELLPVVGDLPVLGVPAGVKMHSAVFAATPRAAGEVARQYLLAADRAALLADAEVLDRDPETAGETAWSPLLFGTLRTPRVPFLVPPAKSVMPVRADDVLAGALERVVEQVADDDRLTIVGPGATMLQLKRRLGAAGTLLGVDVFHGRRCIATDADERSILRLVADRPARIVLSVVGGQGFLLGRGNQQLSAAVIRAVGPENILIVSSLEKLAALDPGVLYVDTGDDTLDAALAGHREVIVGRARSVMMPVRDTRPVDAAGSAGTGA